MTSPASGVDLDPTASHTWTLFADWCSATGHVALPAQPETLAEFLADHPARVSTHRRRVTAINSAHRHRGLSEPGRAHAVHAALATRRHQRLQAVADVLDEAIRQLPVSGWPHGLFGRRDALILTLVAAGLTYTEIAGLRRGDLRRLGRELVIDSDRKWCLGRSSGRPRQVGTRAGDPRRLPHHPHARPLLREPARTGRRSTRAVPRRRRGRTATDRQHRPVGDTPRCGPRP